LRMSWSMRSEASAPPIEFGGEEGLIVDGGVGVGERIDGGGEGKLRVGRVLVGDGLESGLPIVAAVAAAVEFEGCRGILGEARRRFALQLRALGEEVPEGVFDGGGVRVGGADVVGDPSVGGDEADVESDVVAERVQAVEGGFEADGLQRVGIERDSEVRVDVGFVSLWHILLVCQTRMGVPLCGFDSRYGTRFENRIRVFVFGGSISEQSPTTVANSQDVARRNCDGGVPERSDRSSEANNVTGKRMRK